MAKRLWAEMREKQMGINIRQKGQGGEREIADTLNAIIYKVAGDLKLPEEDRRKAASMVQRNQNQSAVGGNDLTNCMGLSIEIKRQEQLSINTWWKQCEAAAARNNETPVLMWRQNRKPWQIRTYAWISLPDRKHKLAVVNFDMDTFKSWFADWVSITLQKDPDALRV